MYFYAVLVLFTHEVSTQHQYILRIRVYEYILYTSIFCVRVYEYILQNKLLK